MINNKRYQEELRKRKEKLNQNPKISDGEGIKIRISTDEIEITICNIVKN